MRSRLLSLALPVLALFSILISPGHAATVQSRITSAVNSNSRVPLEHAVPTRALRSSDLGPAAANRALTNLSLRFSMTAAQQADLTQLLNDQLNPSSPSYHQWLTPEQFGARFGLSSSDLAKVSSWLTSQGFTITETARSSTFISFTGTVAQAQNAFGTSIHSLSLNGEQHISNLTNPTLPSAIAGVVSSVAGLNDFKARPRGRVSRVKLNPDYTYTSTTGTVSHYIAPGDFYTIYNVTPLLTNGIDGTGVTIAVMGQTALVPAQVAAFRTASGLPAKAPTVQSAGSNPPGVISGDIDEASLDVEWSGAVAPNATILYVYGQDVFLNSLTQAITNNVAPIISISYGLCESMINTGYNINTINQLLQQANAQGITIVSAAGDSGATDCDSAGLASEGLAVDFPSTSPFVTSAGGTMFSSDVNAVSTFWNSGNTTNSSSTTPPTYTSSVKADGPYNGYIPEVPWNETTVSGGLSDGGAGGGGASAYFSKPAWQVGLDVPNDGSRDVPDISLNSGAIHDGTIVCSQFNGLNDCTNGFLDSSGNIDVFGGTSVAAPTFAGILALVEQKLGGGGLGNIGPNLYGLANVANVFNTIQAGTNSVSCIPGTPNCPYGGRIGFTASGLSASYNQATGLGSVNAAGLVNGWTAGVPTGGSPISSQCQSNGQPVVCTTATTLTTSSQFCGISASSVPPNSLPLSVKVASVGSSTAIPTGTVQFYVDNQVMGTPVPLVNGAATYMLSTTSLSSGGHNVSVVYSGDTIFASSKGSLLSNSSNTGIVTPIDVISATQRDFSITPCTASKTVTTGSAASAIVLTITPFNGFTGPVNFTVSTDTGTFLSTAFSVNPVTITSTTAVTTSFVLTATTTASLTPAHLKPGSSHRPTGRTPWYAAGSGATLACLVLLVAPRRRRWGALLVVLLSVAAFSASGCGSSSSTTGGGGGGTTTPPAPRGTYNVTITAASSGGLVHSAVLTYTVQ
jgi:subtilase family serine protease